MNDAISVGALVRVLDGAHAGRVGEVVEPLDRFGRWGVHLGRMRNRPRNRGRKMWPYWFADSALSVVEHVQPESEDR